MLARPNGAIQPAEICRRMPMDVRMLTVMATRIPTGTMLTRRLASELTNSVMPSPTKRHNHETVMAMDLVITPPALRATSAPMKQAFKTEPPSTDGVGCRLIDVADNDGDGVINELDTLCPNTPQGEQVNQEGCSQSELDDDEDGVKNNVDLCADTPAGTAVDAQGCSEEQRTSDSDGDGLNDPQDDCPNTGAGQEVDENGCSQAQRDTDGDGLSDLEDACDDTPPGFPILANGCTDESALDTDLDGDGYKGALHL